MAVLAGTTSVTFKATGIVAATMLFVFNFFFAIGLLAIPWLLPSEYAPLPIRAPAAALASASNWIFTFLVVEITPVSIRTIGHYTYVYFCIFNACFVPMIYFFYPETANLSLEQIDYLFTGEKVALHLPPVSKPGRCEMVVSLMSSIYVCLQDSLKLTSCPSEMPLKSSRSPTMGLTNMSRARGLLSCSMWRKKTPQAVLVNVLLEKYSVIS